MRIYLKHWGIFSHMSMKSCRVFLFPFFFVVVVGVFKINLFFIIIIIIYVILIY